MAKFYSALTNSKYSEPRPAGSNINTTVITYSVNDNSDTAINTMFNNGASVHYLIEQDGTILNLQNEDKKAYYAGPSNWHGVSSVGNYAIGIMLVNDAKSEFPAVQIDRTIDLINDINHRHEKTMEVVGLGEVAFNRHVAPGKLFPWDKLAEHQIGRYIVAPDYLTAECTINLNDSEDNVVELQDRLIDYGFGLSVSGTYDESTSKAVSVFKGRYLPHDEQNCWNAQSDYILNELLGIDSHLTYEL
jgi:N-acetylmuramoyl-L-alanine amidase